MSWVYITAESVEQVTPNAICIKYRGQRIWLPKSQIEEPEKFDYGDTDVTIGMSEWIAQQKEIEGEE